MDRLHTVHRQCFAAPPWNEAADRIDDYPRQVARQTAYPGAHGGLLAVADLMPETGLPGVTSRLHPAAGEAAAGMAWTQGWAELRSHERLQPLIREREAIFSRRVPAEFTRPVQWHQDAARRAGFTEAGVVWRWGAHAALVAVA